MQKQPIQINRSFDATVRQNVAVVPIGWSAKKNEQQAFATIGELLGKDDKPFEPSENLRGIITAMFNSDRSIKMTLLKRKLSEEGADIDPITEGFLDLLADEQQFRIFLGTIKDPKTGTTLVEKKQRPNRKKLLEAAFGAQAQEPVEAAPSTAPVSDENPDAKQDVPEPAPVQPTQVNKTPDIQK